MDGQLRACTAACPLAMCPLAACYSPTSPLRGDAAPLAMPRRRSPQLSRPDDRSWTLTAAPPTFPPRGGRLTLAVGGLPAADRVYLKRHLLFTESGRRQPVHPLDRIVGSAPHALRRLRRERGDASAAILVALDAVSQGDPLPPIGTSSGHRYLQWRSPVFSRRRLQAGSGRCGRQSVLGTVGGGASGSS